MKVQVGTIPGRIQKDIGISDSGTVEEAIRATRQNTEGMTITVNGQSAELGSMLHEDDLVMLTKNAKGNYPLDI